MISTSFNIRDVAGSLIDLDLAILNEVLVLEIKMKINFVTHLLFKNMFILV
jgi:hypothetical protein